MTSEESTSSHAGQQVGAARVCEPETARGRATLARPTNRLGGVGLHCGDPAWLRFLPAPAGSGIAFRVLPTGAAIPALVSSIGDTTRCTTLRCNGVAVQTVEHVLSALAGLGIDDAYIEVEGPETPAADGSAAPYVDLLMGAGIVTHGGEIPARVDPLTLTEPVEVVDGHGGSIRALPAGSTSYRVTLSYPNYPYIGDQSASFLPMNQDYRTDIAPARTFGFLSEIESLRARGLALGAGYDNALVLGDNDYLNAPRFENELARHKLLDLIGDLALVGRPVIAEIIAIKPGHQLNAALTAALANLSGGEWGQAGSTMQ
ncbi:MAG: UDP-3-O-acyl-N-acetylglucosamine deacetylase [Capsulimonadaceae bacterium]